MATRFPSYGNLTRFFVPLALQSASQGLTYPLVAMVVSRGPGGALNLAGLSQAHTAMFLMGTLGFGLITTGMVYGKNREGFRRYFQLSVLIAALVAGLQVVASLPGPAHWLFGGIIGLPASIEAPARIALLASIPLQMGFFLRKPYQVALYNGKATGRASLATLVRILITLLMAPLFCLWGLVGPVWAVVCLSLPVGIEVVVSRIMALPFIAALQPAGVQPPSLRALFDFTLPLSLGGFLLSLAAMLMGVFIARAPLPEQMLPVYYLALGVATPLALGATRMQTLVLAFPPRAGRSHDVLRFTLLAGAIMGALPLVLVLPGIDRLYYVGLQKLPPLDLDLVRLTALLLVFYPFGVALRSWAEGRGAWHKKPVLVLGGQAVFLATVVLSASGALWLGAPGSLIGPLGMALGNFAAAGSIVLALNRHLKYGLRSPDGC